LQAVEFCVQAAVALGVGEQRDPFGGGLERDAMPGQTGADPESDAEVGLPVPGGPSRTTLSLPARKSSCPRCRTAVCRSSAERRSRTPPASCALGKLADPDPGQLGILAQRRVDLVLERLQHAHLRHSRVARRLLAPQRPPHRVARQASSRRELLDRLAADEMLASQLSPLLHLNHPSSHLTSPTATRLSNAPDDSAARPRGSVSSGGGGQFSRGARHDRSPRPGQTTSGCEGVVRNTFRRGRFSWPPHQRANSNSADLIENQHEP
jgi:hypothetical protein